MSALEGHPICTEMVVKAPPSPLLLKLLLVSKVNTSVLVDMAEEETPRHGTCHAAIIPDCVRIWKTDFARSVTREASCWRDGARMHGITTGRLL